VDIFAEETKCESDEERQTCARQLCEGLVKAMDRYNLHMLIWPSYEDRASWSPSGTINTLLSEELNMDDLLFAAVAFEDRAVLDRCFDWLPEITRSNVFGSPLTAAIRIGDLDIVKVVLGRIQHEHAEDTRYLTRILDQAIFDAIGSNSVKILTYLLELYGRPNGQLSYRDCQEWFDKGIREGSTDATKVIYQLPTMPRVVLEREPYTDIIYDYPLKFIVEALEYAIMDPNKQWRHSTLLIDAVESRRIPVIGALLDAGADIEGHPADYRRTPLVVATYELNYPVMRYLLSRGAKIPNTTNQEEFIWSMSNEMTEFYDGVRKERGGTGQSVDCGSS
jgi:hypothetical protein